MAKIVSANYRDRKSEYRWLIRDEDEHPDRAVACKEVHARGVEFVLSSEYEEGFGCAKVARCEHAFGLEFEPGERLRFDGHDFVNAQTDAYVRTVDVLTLTKQGGMFAGTLDERDEISNQADQVDAAEAA